MDNLNFSRSSVLNCVPQKKLQERLSSINNSSVDLNIKNLRLTEINRYAESNIPIEYWDLKMERDFHGDARLLTKHNDYITSLKDNYIFGKSILFAGPNGTGKTFVTTSILKKACLKGYSCLYSDMSNIVAVLTQASNEDKFISKRELTLVDFLVIDEMDPRFFSSDAASDLFAKNFESIFRTRRQNKLPTLICTNSPNLTESFNGSLKQSIGSLFADSVENFCVLAPDYRKKKV